MARKSRKHLKGGVQQKPPLPTSSPRMYLAGVYARVSMDERLDDPSIENQLIMAEDFIATMPDIKFVQNYMDKGYSSFDSYRPGFENMMYDIDHKIIDCIIVKDLSRFSRDYLMTGELLQKRFPISGIRFISINDCYDSLHDDPTRLSLALSALVSFVYSKDISSKVHSIIAAKQKDGSYMPSKLPYGYQRSQHLQSQSWELDEITSKIVHMIFAMAMQDMSAYVIAGRLNADGIPSAGGKYWSTGGVLRILRNATYIGTFITGKTRNEITDRIKSVPIPPAKWIRHVHHHMPIVDEAMFYTVQNKLSSRSSPFKKEPLPRDFFGGKLFCGLCGSKMRRKRSGNGSIYYICPKRCDANHVCVNKAKGEIKIIKQVFEVLMARIREAQEYRNKMIKFEHSLYYKNLEHERKIQLGDLNLELKRQEKLLFVLYEEAYSNKSWHPADSKALMLHLSEVRKNLHNQIGAITSARDYYLKAESSGSEEVRKYLQFEDADNLREEMVGVLVDKVLVNMDGVEIVSVNNGEFLLSARKELNCRLLTHF